MISAVFDPNRRGTFRHRAFRLKAEPSGSMRNQHEERHQSAIQRQRIEQAEQRAFVDRPQIVGEMEGHALQRVADRDPEDQCRNRTADEQRPVPVPAPRDTLALGTIFEADRTQDQREQHQEHGEVKAGKAQRIQRRPGGEDGAAAQNEPDLVAFPYRADSIDGDAPLGIVLRHKGQQRADTHVEAIGRGKADEQDAEQQPPDQAQ